MLTYWKMVKIFVLQWIYRPIVISVGGRMIRRTRERVKGKKLCII